MCGVKVPVTSSSLVNFELSCLRVELIRPSITNENHGQTEEISQNDFYWKLHAEKIRHFEIGYLYHFFCANQRKADIKIFS